MGVIDNIIQDKQDIKNQLGSTPSVFPTVKKFNNNFQVSRHSSQAYNTSYSGNMVFILDNPGFGILDTNHLDGSGTQTLYSILPDNNIFYERFLNDIYIDTVNSTGVLNALDGTYTLEIGQTLQSKIIAKLRQPITKILFYDNNTLVDTGGGMSFPIILGEDVFVEDSVRLYVSNDSGVSWKNINENEEYIFIDSSNTDELLYKIESISLDPLVISNPVIIKIN